MIIKILFNLKLTLIYFCIAFLGYSFSCAQGGNEYPPSIETAKEEVYKSVDETDLKVWIISPQNHKEGAMRPAIVFFFGGGWRGGSPTHFRYHAEYFAARGIVSFLVDYRVLSRQGVTADKCIADAKSAMRWVRKHSDRLGIDPDRIVAGGGSAGGHLAAAVELLPAYNDPMDDLSISCKPNAMALFNPVLVLASVSNLWEMPAKNKETLSKRFGGVELQSVSPFHHIAAQTAPSIIFHGTGDKTVSFKSVKLFQNRMKELGNRCELYGYENAGHGFFNYGKNNNGAFIDTVNKLDAFLVSLGYISAPPKVVPE